MEEERTKKMSVNDIILVSKHNFAAILFLNPNRSICIIFYSHKTLFNFFVSIWSGYMQFQIFYRLEVLYNFAPSLMNKK